MGTVSKVGVAFVGLNMDGQVCAAKRIFWPDSLRLEVDQNGVRLGSKSVFLEMVGLLLPLVVCPILIMDQNLVLKVDNLGCYYGWENRNVSNDVHASIVIRAIAVIGGYLNCNIHVNHLPRMSSWEARLCDRLSREKSTNTNDLSLLDSFRDLHVPSQLTDWLESPEKGWDLCDTLLDIVKEKISR
jgi:hypothetical protein